MIQFAYFAKLLASSIHCFINISLFRKQEGEIGLSLGSGAGEGLTERTKTRSIDQYQKQNVTSTRNETVGNLSHLPTLSRVFIIDEFLKIFPEKSFAIAN
jgi:hypothetical protein